MGEEELAREQVDKAYDISIKAESLLITQGVSPGLVHPHMNMSPEGAAQCE